VWWGKNLLLKISSNNIILSTSPFFKKTRI
jgi:hypothetical protein